MSLIITAAITPICDTTSTLAVLDPDAAAARTEQLTHPPACRINIGETDTPAAAVTTAVVTTAAEQALREQGLVLTSPWRQRDTFVPSWEAGAAPAQEPR